MATDQKHEAPNHGDVFAAASVVSAFFDVAYEMVIAKGSRVRWGVRDADRAQAAATLASACATVYAVQSQDRQRKAKKPTP